MYNFFFPFDARPRDASRQSQNASHLIESKLCILRNIQNSRDWLWPPDDAVVEKNPVFLSSLLKMKMNSTTSITHTTFNDEYYNEKQDQVSLRRLYNVFGHGFNSGLSRFHKYGERRAKNFRLTLFPPKPGEDGPLPEPPASEGGALASWGTSVCPLGGCVRPADPLSEGSRLRVELPMRNERRKIQNFY